MAGPKIGPQNNGHHWADWQKRHRAPRAIDLLRKIHEEIRKSAREALALTPTQQKELEEFGVIEPFDDDDASSE